MVTLLALAAALLYGSADFLGGSATKRAHVLAVLLPSAGAGAVVVLIAAAAAGKQAITAGLAWGTAAGAVGGVGLIVFYSGLALGPMIVVAPVSALVSTVLPLGVALAEGERANATVYLGALVCLVAIVMVSTTGSAAKLAGGIRQALHGRAVLYGIGAGLCFGLFFLFLRNAGQAGTLWPTAASRLAGLAVVVLAASLTRTGPVTASAGMAVLLAAIFSGVLDASANVCYLLATRAGLFGLAVVLTSLYPGVTVLLARVVHGERMGRIQQVGLALAAAGVLMVTL
jgi:drug/metabolite transporter (DMT)-like permease